MVSKGTAFGAQRLRPRLRDVRDREQANLRFRHAEICFLGSFFAARQRMNIKHRHRSARDEIALYDRQKKKLLNIFFPQYSLYNYSFFQ